MLGLTARDKQPVVECTGGVARTVGTATIVVRTSLAAVDELSTLVAGERIRRLGQPKPNVIRALLITLLLLLKML